MLIRLAVIHNGFLVVGINSSRGVAQPIGNILGCDVVVFIESQRLKKLGTDRRGKGCV